jgi:hypothetical protein
MTIFICRKQASAAIAQLGERQTEDLKVPGSIPGRGIPFSCDLFIRWVELLIRQSITKCTVRAGFYFEARWSSGMILA